MEVDKKAVNGGHSVSTCMCAWDFTEMTFNLSEGYPHSFENLIKVMSPFPRKKVL